MAVGAWRWVMVLPAPLSGDEGLGAKQHGRERGVGLSPRAELWGSPHWPRLHLGHRTEKRTAGWRRVWIRTRWLSRAPPHPLYPQAELSAEPGAEPSVSCI